MHQGADTGPDDPTGVQKLADPGAAAWQTEPWFAFAREQYRQGILPLWNPYQAYGTPFAANMQSQPFYPLTIALLFHLSPRTYNFYLLARLFVAGICAFLYLRLFLSFPAAITGAIGSMLSGYYIIQISMPHLSVETLLPAMLLATEFVLRRQSYRSVIWLAIVVALVMLGGMPESALLLVSFTAAYTIFRIFSETEHRADWRRRLALFAAGSVAGVGLSCFLILPFYEFMAHSTSPHDLVHKTGLWHDSVDISQLTYLIPLLFGPLYSSSAFAKDQFRNYFGILDIFLVVIAIGCTLRWRRNQSATLNRLTLFFSAFVAAILLKRFGVPPVQWLGIVPLFRVVNFPKYEEAILTCCVWALAAIGIERIWRRHAPLSVQCIAFASAVLPFALAVRVAPSTARTPISGFAIHLAEALLTLLFTCVLIGFIWRARRAWVAPGIVAAVVIELSFNYIVPVYRIYGRLPSVRVNPYAGGPAVRFLQAADKDHSRLFGRDWILTPSWASVFELADIRDMDGLYYQRYFPFVRNFLRSTDPYSSDLESSFLGRGAYDFRLPLEQRLLQLSSVKYLATSTPFSVANPRIEEILQQNQSRLLRDRANLVGRTSFILDGVGRVALAEHPPYSRLPYAFRVPNRGARFCFSYALNPAVFPVTVGDGVGFTIEARDPSGRIEKLFYNYIDPKHNPEQRHWVKGEIDLSRYRGQEIALLFSTDPGPRGDTSFDWAAWSDFHFETDPPQAAPPFKLVYDAEAKIYEYDNVLPRAAIYYGAAVEANDAAVLRKLAEPSLDIFQTVVLNATKMTKQQLAAVEMMKAGGRLDAAHIRSYQSRNVEIGVTLTRNGILVLNDTDYPGWRVSVDDRPSNWFQANYLFRGVLLDPGTHVVRFQYRPASFHWGLAVSLLTLGLLFIPTARILRNQADSNPGSAYRI